MTRNGCRCPPRKRIPRGVRGWMVRPHSINLLFYFSGSPHSPFLHLFLSRFMKGRGGKRGERGRGQSLQGPSAPPETSGLSSATVPPLSSLLPRLFLFLISPVFPPSRPRPRSWSVGWFHYPLLPLVHRWFTHPVSPCLPVSCLSVCHASLSLLCLFRGNSREGGGEGGAPFVRPRFL